MFSPHQFFRVEFQALDSAGCETVWSTTMTWIRWAYCLIIISSLYPIGSMYGTFTYIYLRLAEKSTKCIGEYIIHGFLVWDTMMIWHHNVWDPNSFCQFSMLYFGICLWMLDSNVPHLEVVSSLDLWDFESAHVVCASLVETWLQMIYSPFWVENKTANDWWRLVGHVGGESWN